MRTRRTPYTADELARIRHLETLTPDQAAVIAGISHSTLYAMWQAGTGPASFRVGSARRVRRADLDAWIAGLAKAEKCK